MQDGGQLCEYSMQVRVYTVPVQHDECTSSRTKVFLCCTRSNKCNTKHALTMRIQATQSNRDMQFFHYSVYYCTVIERKKQFMPCREYKRCWYLRGMHNAIMHNTVELHKHSFKYIPSVEQFSQLFFRYYKNLRIQGASFVVQWRVYDECTSSHAKC